MTGQEASPALGDDVFAAVPGQEALVAHLRAATASPVHAYLLVGPRGAGALTAARALAAALLCGDRGCGHCRACRLALDGKHPDGVEFEPAGAFVSIEDARSIIHQSSLSTAEGGRRIYILTEMHRIRDAGPALLKVVEEPPRGVVFVLLADHVPNELVPIASRCLRLDVAPLTDSQVEDILMAEGVTHEAAAVAAASCFGDLDRARLVASDENAAARRQAWASVPDRLDGTGAAVAVVADELLQLIEEAAGALVDRQKEEVAELQARGETTGERISGMRKELEAKHRRELRRHRTLELRSGLSVLGGRYQPLLDGPAAGDAIAAIAAIAEAGEALPHNPREELLLQRLLLRLPAISPRSAGVGLVASTAAPE